MDTTKTTTHIGLCAGYGGIELGLKRVIPNLRSVALCEIEAFACANLVAKMEAGLMEPAPIWTDLKTFPWADFRDRVDILTGGYPCQPFSAAGKRLGTDDPRHLWPFIADGIRLLRPRLCYFENVEGHISLGLREVVGELEQIGYSTAWGIFSASEVGAPHQRKRVFILAYDQQQGLEGLSEFCPSLCRSNKRSFIGNGCSREELANDSSAGLQGNFSGLFNAQGRKKQSRSTGRRSGLGGEIELANSNGARGWEDRESSKSWAACTEQPSSDSRGGESGQIREGQAWPSRPGEQQHGWEPPRVVGGLANSASQRGGSESGDALHEGRPTSETGRESLPQDARWQDGAAIPDNQSTGGDGAELADTKLLGRRGRRDGDAAGLRGEIQTAGSCGGGPEAMGNAERSRLKAFLAHGIRNAEQDAQSAFAYADRRQTQPPLGGDADGPAGGLGYAELQVSCDNRTDELRLLGNGVVPATAERAFLTLMQELLKGTN